MGGRIMWKAKDRIQKEIDKLQVIWDSGDMDNAISGMMSGLRQALNIIEEEE